MTLGMLEYDPNYNYDSDDSDDDMGSDDSDGDESEEEDCFSDDDDMTWKVRRAAAKFLSIVIQTRPDLAEMFFSTVSSKLVSRFKEREESVRVEIFATYISLLKQSGLVAALKGSLFTNEVTSIVKCLSKQVKDKSLKSRQAMVDVLTQLAAIGTGVFSSHMSVVVRTVDFILVDRTSTSNIRIAALNFVGLLLQTHQLSTVKSAIAPLMSPVLASVANSFYKVSAEALVVCSIIVNTIRPSTALPLDDSFNPVVKQLHDATLAHVNATDVDQEVKEKSILCLGQLIALTADELGDELVPSLTILMAKLQNEVTRLTTTQVLGSIAESELDIDLSPILTTTLEALCSFLKKNDRGLRVAALSTLNKLIGGSGASIFSCDRPR